MTCTDDCVTIHPYFTVREGHLEAFRALSERLVERTKLEPACLYYGFSFNGNVAFCREGYAGAEGLLQHLGNVAELLAEGAAISDITRLEVHGIETELAKLREPLAGYPAEWYVLECGIRR